MLYKKIAKIFSALTFLFGCCSLPLNLSAGWSPIPPAPITGAAAVNVTDFFPTVLTTYNSSNHTIVATWLDVNFIPTYAVWNGTSWIVPATNIPGAAALNSNSIPIYSTYDPAHNTIVTTWTDANSHPTYTIWNGSTWTTPTVIPGGSTSSYYSVYTTYDAANQTIVAVWGDQSSNPMSAVLTGYDWTISAAMIPGGIFVETVILSTYDAGSQTVVATWVNSDVVPTYAIWNGSSWSVPATLIPNGGTLTSVLTVTPTYDPATQTVIVTWIESVDASNIPTYAVLQGTTWQVVATAISNTANADAMFFSTYDAGDQTVMTTWLDEAGEGTLMYSIWNGTFWSTPAPIPGSVDNSYLLLQPVYDQGNKTILATWFGLGNFISGETFTPAYAIWDGASWTTAAAIPGASPFIFESGASFLYETYDGFNQSVMVTWLDTNGVPTYAVYTNALATANSFTGYACTNRFLTQSDLIYNLEWTPSSSSFVTGYVLSRNGVPIYSTSTSGPFFYADHNRNKKVTDVYTLVSQGSNGLESEPLTVVFSRGKPVIAR